MTSEEILAEHVVDIHRIEADFRDAFERIQTSSSQSHGVNKYFYSQSPVQRRLSVYNWNPGPRRGTEDAIEKQIVGVQKGEANAQRTQSLSLKTRKLHDKFFSRSRSFRETWCDVFMPQWIESEHVYRKKRK